MGINADIVPLEYSRRAQRIYASAELAVMPGQGHGFTGAARGEAMAREIAFMVEHAGAGIGD